jgi:hypothetical protein
MLLQQTTASALLLSLSAKVTAADSIYFAGGFDDDSRDDLFKVALSYQRAHTQSSSSSTKRGPRTLLCTQHDTTVGLPIIKVVFSLLLFIYLTPPTATDTIYLTGGAGTNLSPSDTIQKYDGSIWTTLSETLVVPRSAHCSVIVDFEGPFAQPRPWFFTPSQVKTRCSPLGD